MKEAYDLSFHEITNSLVTPYDKILDCGAHEGRLHQIISDKVPFERKQYFGIEWNAASAEKAQQKGLNVINGDLNQEMPYPDKEFKCVFGLSLLEHLLNPCCYLKESYRVLQENGKLVILTPNISTYFTALLILLGKMPSSGPHPDSEQLLKKEAIFEVGCGKLKSQSNKETPMHRHLVVFSFRVLRDYLQHIGFKNVVGKGFGLYPFPNFIQPVLEKIDPYHCHQMVFVATK
jgi:SAM-dependent methyltransferase